MIKLHTMEELLSLPPPEWLIQNTFTKGSFVGLYGPSGAGKSFVALDWALCISMGYEWQGKGCEQGPVVYVAAEGGRSIQKRAVAWMMAHKVDMGPGQLPPTFFALEPVHMLSEGNVEELIESILELEEFPKMVVLDTLARCFFGGDENETSDMSTFVEHCGQIQSTTGATVVSVHHTGKDAAKEERGNTAYRGGADTMIKVQRRRDGELLIRCNKQKDDEDFEPIFLELKKVKIDENLTSCVLVAAELQEKRSEEESADEAPSEHDEQEYMPLDDALESVITDASLITLRAQARALAELTGKSPEACRTIMRRRLGIDGE